MVDSDDSDEDDAEIKITGIFQGTKVSHDLFIKAGMEAKVESGLFKAAKSKYPMFPFVEEKVKFDDYGEYIKYHSLLIEDLTTIFDAFCKHLKIFI